MSSKKEEERNEKIIRGLMKLPPNRRCINCNSLGPQYVCTNFWTFVCMTCSGIHREFTHRVKSVSMSKFTSQEVESLQKGGNQRAREAYLNDWDPQRHRLPNSSNAEKVREFIKNVYVDRKYAGGKTSEKPPVDAQNFRHHEEETRRASSYHSYSQSPPYDYQYEERRYGRQVPALTRKPGSDRALYEGKFSNFSSPSRFSDQMLEDRFANEGSNPRASDYSVSSPGDPFSSGTQSPNFQRDTGFRSPPHQTTHIINKQVQKQTMISFLESNTKTDEERVHHPQRTRSSGSFGSFDNNSMSFKSVNSVTLADLVSEPHHSAETHQDKQYAVSSLPQSSGSGNFGGLDLFNTPFVPHTVTSASTIDLFQLPKAQSTPPLDLFEPSSTSSVPGPHAPQPSKTMPPSLDFFSEMPQQLPAATLDNKSKVVVIPKNEGWATFDLAQHTAPNVGVVHSETPGMPPNGGYLGKVDPLTQPSGGLQWPAFEDSNTHEPPSMHNLWHGGPYDSQVSVNATHTQSWDAFLDPTAHLPSSSTQRTGEEFSLHVPPIMDQHDFIKEGIQRTALDSRNPISSVPLHVNNGSSSAPSSISFVESQSQAADRRPTNPFDLADDSDFGSSSMFLNMTSLEAALPSAQLQNSFLNDVSQPWFSHNPVTHYIPSAQQGFMAGQAPSTQMSNVPTQGPVASVGGNPFA